MNKLAVLALWSIGAPAWASSFWHLDVATGNQDFQTDQVNLRGHYNTGKNLVVEGGYLSHLISITAGFDYLWIDDYENQVLFLDGDGQTATLTSYSRYHSMFVEGGLFFHWQAQWFARLHAGYELNWGQRYYQGCGICSYDTDIHATAQGGAYLEPKITWIPFEDKPTHVGLGLTAAYRVSLFNPVRGNAWSLGVSIMQELK